MEVPRWKRICFGAGLLYYVRARERFPPEYVRRLQQKILQSPYLADNNLNYRFAGTQGFSVIFRRDGLQQVRSDFADFVPYLDAALDPDCNAFFLNPLVLRQVARVAPHVDRSLRSVTRPVEPPNPRKVSVLYVEVPSSMRGGELVLYHRFMPIARLRPRTNTLLEFQGFLRHEVSAVGIEGAQRISLVCEQYLLEPDLLQRVPRFSVRSTSSFDAFLQAELSRPEGNDVFARTPDAD